MKRFADARRSDLPMKLSRSGAAASRSTSIRAGGSGGYAASTAVAAQTQSSDLTILSTIFLASASSIIVLSL